MHSIIKYLLLWVLFNSCRNSISQNTSNANTHQNISNHFTNYNLNQPQTILLPSSLKEISGLDYNYNNKRLLANNDEEGVIYEVDPETGVIVDRFKFSGKGDYEGIEFINNKIVIAKSNGDLFFYDVSTKKTKRIKTKLNQSNDVEGVCLHHSNKKILLACKGSTLKEDNHEKAIYSFDINEVKVKKKPYLSIKIKDLKTFFKNNFTDQSKKLHSRIHSFAPSGIATHPKTSDLYVISARGSILLVYNSERILKHLIFLDPSKNPQPEGICFDSEANLYISTEGRVTNSRIFKFKYQNN